MAVFDVSLLRIVYGLIALVSIAGIFIAISWIDWRTRRIPDLLIGALVAIRVLVFVLDCSLGAGEQATASLVRSVVVAVALIAMLLVLKAALERRTHEDCLGMGDVKLVGAGCLFLDLEQAFIALAIASCMGLALALYQRIIHHDKTFPFGPALCFGIGIGLFV